MVWTKADIVTVAAIAAVVDAGTVAVSESLVVVAVEMIKQDQVRGLHGISVQIGTKLKISLPHPLNCFTVLD